MLLTRITKFVFVTLLMGLAVFSLPAFSQQETGKIQVKELNLKEELANLTSKRNLIARELESLKRIKPTNTIYLISKFTSKLSIGFFEPKILIKKTSSRGPILLRNKASPEPQSYKTIKDLGNPPSTHLLHELTDQQSMILYKLTQSFTLKILVPTKQRSTHCISYYMVKTKS